MIRFLFLFSLAMASQAQLAVTLADGTRIIGNPAEDQLLLRSQFGDLTVPLSQVFELQGQGKQLQCRFRNGDNISAELRTPHLQLRTAFGDFRIANDQIREIRPSYLNGIISWWPGDNNADDRWGMHAGVGKCSYVHDRHGRPQAAFHFHDGTETVKVLDHDELDTRETFTLTAWVRPYACAGLEGHRSFIVSKWYTRPSAGNYIFGFADRGKLCLIVSNSDEGYVDDRLDTPADTIPLDTWTHVGVTFRHGHAVLYVNGQPVVRSKFENVTRTNSGEYKYDDISIGGFWSSNYSFRGAIDDVMLFGRALSAAEIATLADVE